MGGLLFFFFFFILLLFGSGAQMCIPSPTLYLMCCAVDVKFLKYTHTHTKHTRAHYRNKKKVQFVLKAFKGFKVRHVSSVEHHDVITWQLAQNKLRHTHTHTRATQMVCGTVRTPCGRPPHCRRTQSQHSDYITRRRP